MLPDPYKYLKEYNIFTQFNTQQCEFIYQNSKQLTISADSTLIRLGATHENMFLLKKGFIKLITEKEGSIIFDHTSKLAKEPISPKRPSLYKVVALTDVDVIVFTMDMVKQALNLA